MATDRFGSALALVLELEGGFVQDPRDPGGATNLGITRATLARARGRPVSVADVRALTREEAGRIYRTTYWDAVRADLLPAGLDVAVFDYAANSGPAQAARSLQTTLRLNPDGRIGPTTIAAAAACDVGETVRALCRERLRMLRGLRTWPAFGKGWTSRVTRVEREALARRLAFAGDPAPTAPDTPIPAAPVKETIMSETKSPLASRTVWANLIGLASLGLGALGVQTGQVDANGLADAIVQVVTGASFVASTVFRVQARKQIGAAVA